jgi:hypothetical protein
LACHLQIDPDPVPDSALHFDADPDPGFLFDADVDAIRMLIRSTKKYADPDPQHRFMLYFLRRAAGY